MMWVALILTGAIIGIALGVLVDHWDKREYYRNFKRNLREMKDE